jgi:hypothetical protein
MGLVSRLKEYFQQIRPLSQCDAEDGRIFGHLLMNLVDTTPNDLPHAVRTFVNRTAALRDCCFRHIASMLVALVDPAPGIGQDAPLASELGTLTEKQATSIGRLLQSRVFTSRSPVATLDRVFRMYGALKEMDATYEWFMPMLEAVVQRKVSAEQRHALIPRRLSRWPSIVAPDEIDSEQEISFDSVTPLPVRHQVLAALNVRSSCTAASDFRYPSIC